MKATIFMIMVVLSLSSRAERLLEQVDFGEINISGEEYWVFDDAKEGNPYSRREIIWSYSAAPTKAQECAKKSYDQLRDWLNDKNSAVYKAMLAHKAAGGVSSLFFWVNDYTKAPQKARAPRRNQIWIWQESLIKYESTLLPDGRCFTPPESQIVDFLNAEIRKRTVESVQVINDHSATDNSSEPVVVNESSRSNPKGFFHQMYDNAIQWISGGSESR